MAHISGKLLCLPATAASPSTNRGCSSSLLARTSAAATMERNLLKETIPALVSLFMVIVPIFVLFFLKILGSSRNT